MAEVDAPPDLAEGVLLVVTELVSNARRHAGGVTGFDVFSRDGLFTVAVSDRSMRSPHLQPQAPRLPGGFGWRLVKTLAPGTFIRFHRGGKTVIAPSPHPRPRPERCPVPPVAVRKTARTRPWPLDRHSAPAAIRGAGFGGRRRVRRLPSERRPSSSADRTLDEGSMQVSGSSIRPGFPNTFCPAAR